MTFDPRSVEAFRFVDYRFDPGGEASGPCVQLRYALEPGPEFVETLEFPGGRTQLTDLEAQALDRSLQHLFVACGVSYYKAAIPSRLDLGPLALTPQAAGFFTTLYRQGLGEMAYRNGLDLSGIRFPADPGARPRPVRAPLPRRTAVAIGGGKDSVVALERVLRCGEPSILISVGAPAAVQRVVEVARGLHPELDHLLVRRMISPELLELNRQGALNGHIPISAVLAFVLATAALLHGFDTVAVANERSANVGSDVGGRLVNHQYSKSFACERAMAELMRSEQNPGFRYVSVLRPLSELAIARAFAALPAYHQAFLSCNRAFRLSAPGKGWCGDCPKCRFVFLALAPFLEKPALLRIFGGRNLLAEPGQAAGYRELAGLRGRKPFECVGEVLESAAALDLLLARPEWKEEAVLRLLADELRGFASRHRKEMEAWCQPSREHAVPERLLESVLAAD